MSRENNAGEAVFVKDGVVLEGTHSNFIAVMDGTVVTYPKCNYILPGITRELVLKICHDLSIPVEQKPVYLSEIHLVQEMMMTGTTMEITPVIKMDGQTVGDGRPGPVTRKLQHAFNEIVRAL
ncbi:aminotransferase class IV [Desulfobacterales bacterium HSG16]|nr:aminotransferase class IV [Desulfobacterales bacterium HSG16]